MCLNPYIVEVSTDAHTRSKYDIEDESVPPSDRSPYSLALFTGLLFRHLSPIMGGGSQPIAHLLKRRNPPVRLKDSMSLLVIVGFIIPDSLSDIAMMTCLKPKVPHNHLLRSKANRLPGQSFTFSSCKYTVRLTFTTVHLQPSKGSWIVSSWRCVAYFYLMKRSARSRCN